MAVNNNPSDLEFLISCIRNGEAKIDFTKVNGDYGWANRSKAQIKYKNLLKAHGLAITGNERYTKPADGSLVIAAPAAATTKRKADDKPTAAKKPTKKTKKDNADEAVAAGGDATGAEKKTNGKVSTEDGSEADNGDKSGDEKS